MVSIILRIGSVTDRLPSYVGLYWCSEYDTTSSACPIDIESCIGTEQGSLFNKFLFKD